MSTPDAIVRTTRETTIPATMLRRGDILAPYGSYNREVVEVTRPLGSTRVVARDADGTLWHFYASTIIHVRRSTEGS